MAVGINLSDAIKRILAFGANTRMTDKEIIETKIQNWKKSDKRKAMITGAKYYAYEHDILLRKRTIIGQDGQIQEVSNLPNNKNIDNQYAKMVDQKKNYLLGKPLTFKSESDAYTEALKTVFNRRFLRTLKNVGEDALNGGIGWLHPYYDEEGQFRFKKFEPYEVKPLWKDAEHTVLEAGIRLYEVQAYEGKQPKIIEKVEIYTLEGIGRYVLENGKLQPDVDNPSGNHMSSYMTGTDENGDPLDLNWERIPLIPFKYNNKEIPLITKVKSLQDGINIMLSDFENNMQEDARNTILVIENYDGTNLAQFRHNLATYGAVKVKSIDGAKGGVKTLTVEVNPENYKVILEIFKKALIENARGFDAKDDRMSGTPNQMNIQSMYSDIDLDANEMETEFQASFEELLWFVNSHLANAGAGDFTTEEVEVIFNRDVLINESEKITNIQASTGIVSEETLRSKHPLVDDPEKEQQRIEKEKKAAMADYSDAFGGKPSGGDGDDQE